MCAGQAREDHVIPRQTQPIVRDATVEQDVVIQVPQCHHGAQMPYPQSVLRVLVPHRRHDVSGVSGLSTSRDMRRSQQARAASSDAWSRAGARVQGCSTRVLC